MVRDGFHGFLSSLIQLLRCLHRIPIRKLSSLTKVFFSQFKVNFSNLFWVHVKFLGNRFNNNAFQVDANS